MGLDKFKALLWTNFWIPNCWLSGSSKYQGMLTIQSSLHSSSFYFLYSSYTLLLFPALDQCWRQDVGLQGPSDIMAVLMLKSSNSGYNSGHYSSSHPFYKGFRRHLMAYPTTFHLSSSFCGSFQKKEVKTKYLREWLWLWLGSRARKLWTLPLFTVSQNIRPLELVPKFLKTIVYINNSFIFKKILFVLNTAPMITNFCLLCGLK